MMITMKMMVRMKMAMSVNERLEDQNDKQRAEEIFYEVLEQRTDVKKQR